MKGSSMKKLIASLVAGSMLISTPVIARDHDRQDRREWRDRGERRGGGCGWLCGAIIGGVVVGALSSNNRDRERNRQREFDNRYIPPDYRRDSRNCVREQVTEWYRGERYIYWQTVCNF
jgi:hypothetical protein